MTQGTLNFTPSPKCSPTITSQKQDKSLNNDYSEEEKKKETTEEQKEKGGVSSYEFIEIDDIMERPSSRWNKKPNKVVSLKRGLMDLWKGTSESDLVSQSSGCMSITEGPFEIVRPDSSEKKSTETGKKKRKIDKK